jgi:hypothetical protein
LPLGDVALDQGFQQQLGTVIEHVWRLFCILATAWEAAPGNCEPTLKRGPV